jgi:tellurite resistance protein
MADFWGTVRPMLTSDITLVSIGVILSILAIVAWVMSNRAEATPNEDQLAEMRHFVNDHFAKYVAHGLVAEGVGPVAISQDPSWRKVYLQHLRLHNELYAFRKDIALRLFESDIDSAVRRELDALRAAGQRANPAVAS